MQWKKFTKKVEMQWKKFVHMNLWNNTENIATEIGK